MNCAICKKAKQEFVFKKNDFELFRCVSCGHVMISPLPENTEALYCDDYFSGAEKGFGYVNYDRDKEPMRKVFEKSLLRAEKLLRGKRMLLDVGAATGFFMGIAKERGWKTQGVEISSFAGTKARMNGLDVITGTLETAQFKKNSFHLITLWDVLEHFTDPKENIKKTYELLKPHGLLFINTPDIGSIYAKMLGKNWHLLVPPEHIHYFTRKSISTLLLNCGFEIVYIGTMGKSFTLEYVFSTLARWRNSKFFNKTTNFLKKYPKLAHFSLPINLRDNMFVIAKKI